MSKYFKYKNSFQNAIYSDIIIKVVDEPYVRFATGAVHVGTATQEVADNLTKLVEDFLCERLYDGSNQSPPMTILNVLSLDDVTKQLKVEESK